MKFSDPYEGWVGLSGNRLYKTRDEGQSWRFSNPHDNNVYNYEFLDFNTGWVSSFSHLYFTVDGGAHWEEGEYEGNGINDQVGRVVGVSMEVGIPEDMPENWCNISVTHDGGGVLVSPT